MDDVMRRRASSRRLLDLAIRSGLLVTVSCASLDGLSTPDPADGKGAPDRSPSERSKNDGGMLDAEPSPGTFCQATNATFCADFERDLLTGWPSRTQVHGDTRLVESSFAAVTEPVAEGVVPRAYLRKDFAANELLGKDAIDYTFAVRMDQVGATPSKGGSLAVLMLGTEPLDYQLQLNVFADGRTVLTERGPAADGGARYYAEHSLPPFAVGRWRRIEVRLKRGGGGGSFEVSIDGADVLASKNSGVALPDGAVSFFVGVTYVDPPAAPWAVRYDDVAVDLH
jgi:hypothetical protein